MKYNELPKQWQKVAKQWVIDKLNQIEAEAGTGYIVSEQSELDQIVIEEILAEYNYRLEYNEDSQEEFLIY